MRLHHYPLPVPNVTDPALLAVLVADLRSIGWALVDGPEETWPILEAVLPAVTEGVGRDITYERGPTAWVLAAVQPSPPHAPRRQSTRMIKLSCPADGYTVRATRKWIEVGLPRCPCGRELTRTT